ncbi:MAG: shikimate kinase [Planctomycetota bacterium]|nr:shikimate kinase [Planctomycetota bacterium]
MSRAAETVALIGLRCTGKTSVGRCLARLSGRPFVDLDREIERAWAGGSVDEQRSSATPSAGELLGELGESAFRDLEEAALRAVLQCGGAPVLATGGGAVERAVCRELLARCRCVWLRADPRVLAARMAADPVPRPALGSGSAADELAGLAQQREAWFVQLACLVVESGEEEVAVLARGILTALDLG